MDVDQWDTLSAWLNAWLEADAAGRERLRAQLEVEHPELVAEAGALATASGELHGFLETPALVLEARQLAQDTPTLPAGCMVGPYQVVNLLARGGMGDVYRATDVRLRRDVALKVLATARRVDPDRVERFMHEARVTASVDHPNVMRVYDVGRFGDQAYLIAELLDGETLRARVDRGPMSVPAVLAIGLEVANGLVAAHAAGLVHRDLKPDNIFLTSGGQTKILDFGIAKLVEDEAMREGFSTLTGVVLGTAGYLAPEQLRGETVDARADLFAFGAVLFEMLAGTRAFARDHLVETLHAILHDPPAPLSREDVPPALAAIVMRLLSKSPDDRFQSAADVITALQQLDPGAPGTRWRHPRTAVARRWWMGAAAGIAVVAAFLAFGRDWVRAPAPASRLAVIPFRSLPAAADSELLELGLAEAFIGRLGQLPDVTVLPLTATEGLRSKDALQEGRRLGATHVLTGTLQREGSNVRAHVQLLAPKDGRIIWSTTIDERASSAFEIQDDILARILDELAPRLSTTARQKLTQPGTANTEAEQAYLRGRYHVRKPTPGDLTRAAEFFQQAVQLDPRYADAWAGLGSAYKRMPVVGVGIVADPFVKARDAATRALAIDRDHPEAHSVLGTVAFWHEWDYDRAEQLLRRALVLRPSDLDARTFLAHVYSNVGRPEDALEQIQRARALDPAWPVPRSLEGQFLLMARRFDEALVRLDALVQDHADQPEIWNAHYFRAHTLLLLGRYDDSIAAYHRVIALRQQLDPASGPHSGALAHKGYALARLGRRAEAEAILAQIRMRRRPDAGPNPLEAFVLHGLGRDGEALVILQAAALDRRSSVAMSFLGVDPKWDGLRETAAFRAVLTRVNLLDVSDRVIARVRTGER